MLLAKKTRTEEEAKILLEETIYSKAAYKKFVELIKYQYGDVNYVKKPELLPKASYIIEVKSPKEGYVKAFAEKKLGKCALIGAGRKHGI